MSESWRGKLVGLGLGWFATGPIGAILGGILGSFYDEKNDTADDNTLNEGEEQAIYHAYLVSLFVYIAKADGKLSSVEIRIIRDFFKKKGATEQEMMQIKEALKIAAKIKVIKIEEIVDQINQIFDYHTKLNILELCYHIAAADKVISESEAVKLTTLGNLMKINIMDQYDLEMKYGFESIDKQEKNRKIDEELENLKREMRGEKRKSSYSSSHSGSKSSGSNNKQSSHSYRKTTERKKYRSSWEILGVKEGASYREVKRAYIKLQQKYHPDINPSKEAEEIIKEVNLAYDDLKKKFE